MKKGKKIYDPRENSHDASDPTTWEWSDNPALIFRDYLQDTNYGLRATTSEINDTTNAGGIQAAANICDQDVLLADNTTTEKRYTANGFTNFGASGEGVLSGILSSMAGKMSYTNGQFNLFAGTTQTASLTITDAECLSTMQIATNPNNGDLYNAVKAIYTDSTGEKYVGTDSAIYKDTTFLNADTPTGESTANFLKMQEVQLPFTVTDSMAQRISRISLKHQRQTTTVQVVTTINYMKLQDLKRKNPADLISEAEKLGIENPSTLRKQEILFAILKKLAEKNEQISASGVLEVLQDGFGFLRAIESNYLPGPDDIYVSPSQIRRFGLRTGDSVEGEIRAPKEAERYFALLKINNIN